MPRGLGKVQRRILELLDTTPPRRDGVSSHRKLEDPDAPGWTTADLAAVFGLTTSRIRVTVKAMEARELIVCTWEELSRLPSTATGGPAPAHTHGWVVWKPEQAEQWRPNVWAEIQLSHRIRGASKWWAELTPDERWAQVNAEYARALIDDNLPDFRAWYGALTPEEREAEILRRIIADRGLSTLRPGLSTHLQGPPVGVSNALPTAAVRPSSVMT